MTPQIKQRIEQIQRGEVPDGYKKTKVGIVPAEWAVCNMGNIYSERKESGDPNLPILTVSIHSGVSSGELNESELGKKVKRIEDKTQYLTARNGDLVFNMMRAWQGAIGVAQADGLVSPAYVVAKPIIKLNPAFMDKYIKLPESINSLHKKSYGVTDFRLRLYWDSFIKVDCCLPPLPEQEKIAEILMTQDRVIELCEKKVEQLKKLKKAFLQKMFPIRGSSVPELRFSGFTTPWKRQQFSDLYEKINEKNDLMYGKDDIISVANMYFKPDSHIADPEYLRTYNIFHLGDIAFEGNKSKHFAHGRFVENTIGNGIVSHVFDVFRPIKEYDLLFWKYAIDNECIMGEVLVRCTKASTMMTNLVTNHFLQESILVPCIEEQRKIGVFLDKLDNFIILHQRKCDEEKQKKKALMQLLLTGVVRIKT